MISLFQIYKKLEDGTFGADEEGADGLKTSGSRAMDAYRMKQTGATATFDPTRGGAQVGQPPQIYFVFHTRLDVHASAE